jgi:mannose-6-phosphate isomerase-like protein (cupin superfamily)
MSASDAATPPVFPGATSVSELEVYDGVAPDGLAGGTPHLHTVSAEAYLVIGGRGRLQTIDGSGVFEEHPLEPGALVWFDPGVIHRVVNDGALEVRVIMQNAGLPEAGDAVMTFPDEVLADRASYRSAAALPGADRPDDERLAAAHRRRDLAVDGFRALFGTDGAVDRARLALLHERAVALVAPYVPEWRERWRAGALAAANETGYRLDALGAASDPGLAQARVASAPSAAAFGMCGRLRRYETQEEQPATPKETDV